MEKTHEKNWKNDYVVKNTFRSFVVVSVLSALAATAGMLIDNIIVGHFLGREALGAMAVVGPVSLIFSAVGNICSGGGTARAAQAIGKGDYEEVNRVFSTTMIFVVVSGTLLMAGGLLFTPQIAAFLGDKKEAELMMLSTEYLRGFFLGAVPTIMMSTLMGFVRIDGSPKLPLATILVMSVADVVLDLAMVLVFHQGMFGMALATTLSYVLAVLVACTHFFTRHHTLRFVIPKSIWTELSGIVKTGAPSAISRICDTVKITVLNNLLLGVAGAAAVSAMGVRNQAENIVGALAVGIGQAVVPVAGIFFGEEDGTALKDTLKNTFQTGLVLNTAVAVILLVFPNMFSVILGLKSAPEIQRMAAFAIRIFAVAMPLRVVNTILMNFYQSTKRTGLATIICLMQSLIYTIAAALILVPILGVNGVWLSFLAGECCTLLSVLLLITFRLHRFPDSIRALMLLDSDFGGRADDRLEISIGNSMEEVLRISEGIHKFARNRNIDKNLMNHVALCIEEMAGNVVQYAFQDGEERWLDVMLLDRQDRLVLRLRDNGNSFDPLEFLKNLDEAQRERYLGIRLVQSLADDLTYRRCIGLNNLTITFLKD